MDNLAHIVLGMVSESIEKVRCLGDKGKENVPSEESKRTCLAEKIVHENIIEIANECFDSYELMTEGFKPFVKGEKSRLKIIVDPIDGTAYYARSNSANSFPVSIVVSIMDGMKYKDVKAAAIGDLNTEEIWWATDKTKAKSDKQGEIHVGGNEEHDPVWSSDFYFPENAYLRTLLKHPENPEWNRFECLNSGSMAEQGAKLACGELDLVYNVVGPKGYELAAMYRIVKQAGGHCLYLPTGEKMGEIEFQFNERVPVVLSKDRSLAEIIFELYKSEFNWK